MAFAAAASAAKTVQAAFKHLERILVVLEWSTGHADILDFVQALSPGVSLKQIHL